jgi:hypothetical protein
MLDPRIYRAALIPIVFALIVGAFSLSDLARPAATTLAPDAFLSARAMADLDAMAAEFPDRRAGDAGDSGLAARIAARFRALGSYQVSTPTYEGETADGTRRLTSVIARQVGQPGPGLVVVSHRDALGRRARAELSGTAAMLELARVASGGQLRRTVTFASVSGGAAGLAGARDLVHRIARPADAVLVLGDLAGRRVRQPLVVPWSTGGGAGPMQLRRTVEAAVRSQTRFDPGGPHANAQWVRMAFPVTLGEQGPLVAGGLPAVLLSAGGEQPPPAGEPVMAAHMRGFGRAALRTLLALDNSPDLGAGTTRDLVTLRKVLPAWAVRMLVAALLLAPLLTTIDGFARVRRRHEPVAAWVGRIAAGAVAVVVALSFAWLIGAVGLLPATPPELVPARAIPVGGAGVAALVAIALVGALAWLVVRPMLLRRLAPGTLGRRLEGEGAGAALLVLWCALAVVLWLANPYAAALLVPGAHLFLAVVEPGLRLRRALAVALVAIAALPFVLVLLAVAGQVGMGPAEFAWACVLLVAGGVIGPLGWIVWSVVLACLVAATLLAVRATPANAPVPPAQYSVRGPLTYAGPGSLGGTESALRR